MIIIHPKDISNIKCRDPVTLECEVCHDHFIRPKNYVLSYIKNNNGKYCSKPCQTIGQRTGKDVPCKTCGKIIYKQKGDLNNNVFCSRSCAATFNGHKFPKREPAKNNKCACGKKKDSKALSCHRCKRMRCLEIALNRTIRDTLSKGNARVKYSQIRTISHTVLELNNVPKQCYVCQFDFSVDVCHIKPIFKFNEKTLLKQVNSLKNLIYLCPNHHRMLDRNALSIIKNHIPAK